MLLGRLHVCLRVDVRSSIVALVRLIVLALVPAPRRLCNRGVILLTATVYIATICSVPTPRYDFCSLVRFSVIHIRTIIYARCNVYYFTYPNN